MSERVKIVIPGDDPVQIARSPHLERLVPYGDVVVYDTRPADSAEKIARTADAQIIINSRGSVTWRAEELRSLGLETAAPILSAWSEHMRGSFGQSFKL